ncbi:hypothetical protein ASPFODRAFT_29318 [Aspergillus luchuensis CBS 106.47]|uniref:Uncharacterized protein n=1 Tax=Aspergillus luchuensis (strain CBS 106.47) TaxID=1137211 RepID=A0A1M3TVX9_ASPLC|nr:hypothetical protein ASPFODRAFT_29318 [Aspergillus luchuensis CBS 106.47]
MSLQRLTLSMVWVLGSAERFLIHFHEKYAGFRYCSQIIGERYLGKVNSDADHCFTTPEGDTNVVDPSGMINTRHWHSDDLLMMVKAIEEEGDRDVAGTGIQCIHSYKFTHLPDKGAHGYLALACGLH